MRSVLLLGIAAAIAGAAPRRAQACGRAAQPDDNTAAIVLTIVAADAALTLWDSGSALVSHRPSKAYGVVELLVAGPQLALGIYALSISNSPATTSGSAVYSFWMGLLTAHALWTLAAPQPSEPLALPPPPPEPEARVRFGPTLAAVGQQAKPGFGLVGRF